MMFRRVLSLLALLFSAAPALAQGDPSFLVVNRTGQVIEQIYVSPVSQPNWGRDWLGNDVLPSGRSFPIRIAPAAGCRHDIRVVHAGGRAEERRNQDTCAITEVVFGTAAAPPQAGAQAGQQNPSFNLVNHGGQPIREIYVTSVRQGDWGGDRLGAATLPPGRWLEVRLPLNDCLNDIRIVWMDGRAEERRQMDTCRVVNLVFR
jgi:hypothetical protein